MNRKFEFRHLLLVTLGTSLVLHVCTGLARGENLIAHVQANATGSAPFSFDHANYPASLQNLPIGVFDSGIGGLTVLDAILSLDAFNNDNLQPGADGRPDFEHERFIYLGDQANMPYGNYPASGKTDYLRELILKDAVFLLGKRYHQTVDAPALLDKPPVKAIVIACNTATAYGLQDIRAALKTWNIPVMVIGVVEAGGRGVMEKMHANQENNTVAVLATVGTCGSNAYPKAIGSAVGLAGKPMPQVIQQGSVGLAGAIEGDPSFISDSGAASRKVPYQGPAAGSRDAPLDLPDIDRFGFEKAGLLNLPESLQLNSVTNYTRYDVTTLVENYRKSGGIKPIDTVVLGCTHYPLVQKEIASAFERLRTFEDSGSLPYDGLVARKIQFVNPAELTAKELFRTLATQRIRLKKGELCLLKQNLFFMSIPNARWPGIKLATDGGLDRGYKYSRTAGQLSTEDTLNVPMRIELLPPASLHLIRTHLPQVWTSLTAHQE